jgi:hypothetical protein
MELFKMDNIHHLFLILMFLVVGCLACGGAPGKWRETVCTIKEISNITSTEVFCGQNCIEASLSFSLDLSFIDIGDDKRPIIRAFQKIGPKTYVVGSEDYQNFMDLHNSLSIQEFVDCRYRRERIYGGAPARFWNVQIIYNSTILPEQRNEISVVVNYWLSWFSS